MTLLLLPLARAVWALRAAFVEPPVVDSSQSSPRVSVVVPARNEELAIGDCVRSLLAQRYSNFEVIVLDDRSTDRTPEILGEIAAVNDPRRPPAKAVGQFMLFRATSYRRIGGHESVKDEIVDDFALARRVKGTGHRLLLASGRSLVSTRMYHSLGEIWAGFSKN